MSDLDVQPIQERVEESQIPMIPRAAQERLAAAEADREALREALQEIAASADLSWDGAANLITIAKTVLARLSSSNQETP